MTSTEQTYAPPAAPVPRTAPASPPKLQRRWVPGRSLIRTLAPSYPCAPADHSPSPKGEGRGEGECIAPAAHQLTALGQPSPTFANRPGVPPACPPKLQRRWVLRRFSRSTPLAKLLSFSHQPSAFSLRSPSPRTYLLAFSLYTLYFSPPAASAQTNNPAPPPAANIYEHHSYHDPVTGTTFYVESDLRHVVALDPAGKILWCRQPALEGNLPSYSPQHPTTNPPIVWLGGPGDSRSERLKTTGSGRFIGLSFNSRQGGVMDEKTGDFTFEGQR